MQRKEEAVQRKEWTAIVTGGGSGIGGAVAERLATRQGGTVVVVDCDGGRAAATADTITSRGGRAESHELSVTDAGAIEGLIHQVDAVTPLRYMFNNAGIGGTLPFAQATSAHWDRVLELILRAVIAGTTAAYAVMRPRGDGHIVNTASIAGLMPMPGQTLYNTSKFAVVGLSLTLRPEAAINGVRLSVVCPGNVVSDIWRHPIIGPSAVTGRVPADAVSAERARRILVGIHRNRAVIAFPRRAERLVRLFRTRPRRWDRWFEAVLRRSAG